MTATSDDRIKADEAAIEASKAPLIEHLIELRSRLIKAMLGFIACFIISFIFSKQIFQILVLPYEWAADYLKIPRTEVKLIYTAPLEYFFTQLKIGMFGGAFLAFPLIAVQFYKFPRQRQSDTRSLVFPRIADFRLPEGIDHPRQVFSRNSDPGVRY